ncbi:MAG: 50S ribosomal protein L13 [Candidatus Pacearchaeota archaeon]
MAKKIIIDAQETILGRLASFAAKQALEGNDIIILNSEKAIISGNKKNIIEKYRKLRKKGGYSQKGPKYSKLSYRIVKRAIRGMLPDFRWGEGREALKRIKCYEGIPKEYENQEMVKIKTNKTNKFIEIKELSEKL